MAALAGAAVVGLAVVATASPALADADLVVNLDSPAVDGAHAAVSGSAQMSGPLDWITGVRITVTSRTHPGAAGAGASCDGCGATVNQGPSTPFSLATPGLAYNGPYDVKVVATGQKIIGAVTDGSPVSTQATTAFKVEVPPAPPADVTANANPDGSVTVQWSRNTEPDLVGYQVQRRVGSSSFQPMGSAVPQPGDGTTVRWTDASTAPTGGQYEYVVVAVRPDGDGAVSDRATASSAEAGVSVPVPPGVAPGSPGAAGNGAPGSGVATPAPGAPSTTKSAPLDVGSFLSPGGAVPAPSVPGAQTIPDGGFSETLKYGSQTPAHDGGGDAVVGLSDSTSRKKLLLPVAAGLVLCMTAAHLRRFNRRAAGSTPSP
ncbi:MAG TPA: hypothetical protein VHS52_04325 [Acidimicrobiales bacterium]|nr:hypothetical protein [Acidimicrobiales bacterium]